MLKKMLPLLFLCGMVSAAELPDSWKPYMSAKNAEPGTVTLQDKMVRVVDPGKGVEAGITQTIPCAPGDYVRLTVDVKQAGDKAMQNMEISAYYVPWRKDRAGTTSITAPGQYVLVTGPAPENVKKLQFYVYSYRNNTNDVLVSIPKVEISKTPFTAK